MQYHGSLPEFQCSFPVLDLGLAWQAQVRCGQLDEQCLVDASNVWMPCLIADNARHVESLRPHARLHSLWRLGSVRSPRSRSFDIGHLQNGAVE